MSSKSVYRRGQETGLQASQGEGVLVPYHYKPNERSEWLEGWCDGYLERWGQERHPVTGNVMPKDDAV